MITMNVAKQILIEDNNMKKLCAFLLAFFYKKSEAINALLNALNVEPEIFYVRTFISEIIVQRLQSNLSLLSEHVARFVFLMNMLQNNGNMNDTFLQDMHFVEAYKKIFPSCYFDVYNGEEEATIEVPLFSLQKSDYILNDNGLIDITQSVYAWMEAEIMQKGRYNCKFNKLPYIITIAVDIEMSSLEIFEAIRFQNVHDDTQKSLAWSIHSLILQDQDEYRILIHMQDAEWQHLCSSDIPANREIESKDLTKCPGRLKMIIYKAK